MWHEPNLSPRGTNGDIASPLLAATEGRTFIRYDGPRGDAAGGDRCASTDDWLTGRDGVFDERNECCFISDGDWKRIEQIFYFDSGGDCQFHGSVPGQGFPSQQQVRESALTHPCFSGEFRPGKFFRIDAPSDLYKQVVEQSVDVHISEYFS